MGFFLFGVCFFLWLVGGFFLGVFFFYFCLIQKESPDLHRYHVSAGSSKLLYLAVFALYFLNQERGEAEA